MWLELEFAYHDITVKHVSHYATEMLEMGCGISPSYLIPLSEERWNIYYEHIAWYVFIVLMAY